MRKKTHTQITLEKIAKYGKGVFVSSMFESSNSIRSWLKRNKDLFRSSTYDISFRNSESVSNSIYVLNRKFAKASGIDFRSTESVHFSTLMDISLVNSFMLENECFQNYSKPFNLRIELENKIYAFFTYQYGIPGNDDYDILVSYGEKLLPNMSENQKLIFKSKEVIVPKAIAAFKA